MLWMPLISLARKAYKSRKNAQTNMASPKARAPPSPTRAVRFAAILPTVIIAIAFILGFLCIFAGNKPGYMEDYFVFRLNTTRIGSNLIKKIDDKIMDYHFELKRDIPEPALATVTSASVPVTTVTPGPATTITMAPRGIDDFLEDITSDAAEAKSDLGDAAESKASAVESKVESKASAVQSKPTAVASSMESAVESRISTAIGSLQTQAVKAVNDAYGNVIEELELQGFYSIHVSSTCEGTYRYQNGTNVTVGSIANPEEDGKIRAHVDSCEKRSDLDPMSLIKVLYWAGVISTGITLATSLAAIILTGRKWAIINAVGSAPPFIIFLLASSTTHGIGMGGAKFVNFIGNGIGLEAYKGGKFIALTWACTTLVLLNGIIWALLAVQRHRAEKKAVNQPDFEAGPGGLGSGFGLASKSFRKNKRPDRTSQILMEPQPTHDRHAQQWI